MRLSRWVLVVFMAWSVVHEPCHVVERSLAAEPVKSAAEGKRPANRLAKETSPYLLLHAHNPVDWYPWGEEALAKARREKKLIFLSIGYSSCYWCHVMERESFMDDEIAAFLNKHFVCIKVDREERPDIDEVYMRALQVYLQLAGSPQGGGWPLSMFLSPDAKPLMGGTYFPPRDKDGRMGFLSILTRVHGAWEAEPDKWQKVADQLAEIVKESLAQRPNILPVELTAELLDDVQTALAEQFDKQHGGFGYNEENPRVPKFPEPANLVFLLARARDGNAAAREMLLTTLEKMAAGGIRDHLGGGFHRYSTDRFWRVPHFEKMLYDNGQLASVYAEAYALEPRPEFKFVVEELADFVLRELTSEQGAFYSALDAETDGEEGRFYVWQRDEVQRLLSPEAYQLFEAVYGFDGEPNFEQRYIPLLKQPLEETAAGHQLSVEQLNQRLQAIRKQLLAARDQRERPLTDTKILTGWNGLMIGGLADAGRILQRPEYVQASERAAQYVLDSLRTAEGRLLRTHRKELAPLPGFLDDYAYFVSGLTKLHQATGDRRWLEAADELTAKQIELFADERGGFYFTSEEHEELIARSKIPTDGAVPSGNSVSAANLIYLAQALDKPEYLQRAEKAIQAAAPLMQQSPAAAPQTAAALDALLKLRAAQPPSRPDKPAKKDAAGER